MTAIALTVLLQDRYETVVSFSLPIEVVQEYTVAENGSFIAWLVYDAERRDLSGAYRYDAASGRLEKISDGHWLSQQQDFGSEIASLESDTSVEHYDVKTGELIYLEPKLPRVTRVGDWATSHFDGESRVTNVRTGRSFREPQVTTVVWASPQRVFTVVRPEARRSPDAYYRLDERDPKDFSIKRTVSFGDNELGDFRIVGDPTKPPFVIERSFVGAGVEAFSYDVVRADFTWTGRSHRAVFAFQGRRYLAGTPTDDPDDTYTRCAGVECRDLQSETIVWSRRFGQTVCGVAWQGNEVHVGLEDRTEVLSSGSGATLRAVPGRSALTLPRAQREAPKWRIVSEGARDTFRLEKRSD